MKSRYNLIFIGCNFLYKINSWAKSNIKNKIYERRSSTKQSTINSFTIVWARRTPTLSASSPMTGFSSSMKHKESSTTPIHPNPPPSKQFRKSLKLKPIKSKSLSPSSNKYRKHQPSPSNTIAKITKTKTQGLNGSLPSAQGDWQLLGSKWLKDIKEHKSPNC